MTDKERLDLMMSTNLAGIVKDDFLKWLGENGFFNAPASTKYHGNYAGGLFDHSFMVMNLLVELSAANALKWKRPASPFIVGMFHDLCKIDQYRGTCCKDGALHDHIVCPQIRSGSFSDFSSSPPMYGMIFPTISGQSLNVFPAPEIA